MTTKVLIVEDNLVLAHDLADQLDEHGFEVLGPCATTTEALEVISSSAVEVAVLDIDLGTETSERVAKKLEAERIPFIVASGLPANNWPPAFKGRAATPKPIVTGDLVTLIKHSDGP